MEFKKIVQSINLPLSAFLIYLCKSLIFGTSYADIGIMLVLGSVFCVIEYYKAKKEIITETKFRIEIQNELQLIKSELARQKIGAGMFAGRQRK